MLICIRCGKGKNTVSFSRHKKGSSGAGGVWALRAPIHKRAQRPNLHIFKGQKYCTKCLRIVKQVVRVNKKTDSQTPTESEQPAQAAL
ncbi:hypothetical protein A2867_02550 [Candidatus Daviesbacteria bacterium RIFCSPHIGHO2_01_FULL_40_11]|uniref:50S ribosomal protein L28 n=1 Tax=Candidatus Daviesbacteria bacterium RIFCSPHIGHO2_01_FULL_40_11 TaxID=1797762 RepID=A0A1F5JFT3_9BACT|nr:MAG: hypothetical protein A2867_02550 [Candidatus Daviesbacteria bacterium RIFCSPHIGHO2_01_FULL_40_11]